MLGHLRLMNLTLMYFCLASKYIFTFLFLISTYQPLNYITNIYITQLVTRTVPVTSYIIYKLLWFHYFMQARQNKIYQT